MYFSYLFKLSSLPGIEKSKSNYTTIQVELSSFKSKSLPVTYEA